MWMNIVGGFSRGFGIARHMIADVVLHQLGHEAVDGAARGGEALEGVRARFIVVQSTKNTFRAAR